MCCKRQRSAGVMTDARSPHHLVAEIGAQVVGRTQIHLAPLEHNRQLRLDLHHVQQGRPCGWLEFNPAFGPNQAFIALRVPAGSAWFDDADPLKGNIRADPLDLLPEKKEEEKRRFRE